MAYEFYLGIDPDNDSEKVTIALVEKAEYQREDVSSYHVRTLVQRDATEVEQVAEYIQNLIAGVPYVGRTGLVVNRTRKPGRKLLECLVEEGLSPIAVTITGGDSSGQNGAGLKSGRGGDSADGNGGFIVSEHELVETIEDLYQGGQLKMEQDSPEVSALADGLQSYEALAPEAGYALDRIDAEPGRQADHGSFVLGAALACWYGEQHSFNPLEHMDDELPATGEARRMLRPDTGP